MDEAIIKAKSSLHNKKLFVKECAWPLISLEIH